MLYKYTAQGEGATNHDATLLKPQGTQWTALKNNIPKIATFGFKKWKRLRLFHYQSSGKLFIKSLGIVDFISHFRNFVALFILKMVSWNVLDVVFFEEFKTTAIQRHTLVS